MKIDLNKSDRFTYRVAGLIRHQDRILLHRADYEDFWALPGGGCEFYEESHNALKREFKEELSASIEVTKLLWIVENFYNYESKRVHEIGLYYHCKFIGESTKYYDYDSFKGTEAFLHAKKPFKLIFEWVPISQLYKVDLRPSFLSKEIESSCEYPRHFSYSS